MQHFPTTSICTQCIISQPKENSPSHSRREFPSLQRDISIQPSYRNRRRILPSHSRQEFPSLQSDISTHSACWHHIETEGEFSPATRDGNSLRIRYGFIRIPAFTLHQPHQSPSAPRPSPTLKLCNIIQSGIHRSELNLNRKRNRSYQNYCQNVTNNQ